MLLLLTSLSQTAKGQGCSDAGFCTIHSFKPAADDSIESDKNNIIKFGISNGKADHSISILGSYFEYDRQLSQKFSIDIKLSFMSQNGNSIGSSGLSDLFVSTNYSITKAFKFTFGTKIPLNDGNKSKSGSPLPMGYQSSLGTLDMILGIAWQYENIKFVFALQQPLRQNNNRFLAENYPLSSIFRQFQSTNKYIRRGDFLFRASYPINVTKKMTLTPSALPIYHFKDDKFSDSNGVEMKISGSQGLTLNGNIYADYAINASNSIGLNFGMPFKSRRIRPDGLTRSYVLTLEYKVTF